MKALIILLFFLSCQVQSIFSQQWNQLGSGIAGIVTIFDIAPAGNSVYTGGDFTDAGGNPDADYFARWDSCHWSAVGPGVNGIVRAIAVSGNDVYIGGDFTEPFPYLARWDGSQWNAVGSAHISPVFDILIDGANLFIAGDSFVSQWNASSWVTLGTFNGPVTLLAKDGNMLYASGNFTDAGGNPNADYITMFDGIIWNNLGVSDPWPPWYFIEDILIFNDELYVAGFFQNIGGVPGADNFVKWDGSNWVGLNFPSFGVSSLVEYQGALFGIHQDDPQLPSGIYEWEPGAGDWELFEIVVDYLWFGLLTPLASDGDNLYIGGDYIMGINNEAYNAIARWGPPDGCPVCQTLNATGEITNPLCAGSSNGSINITPPNNGTPPYIYNWSNGTTTEDISGLSAINYFLTISDGSSCTTTFSFALTEPPAITLNIIDQPITCNGEADGELTAITSGGTPGYIYQWSNGGGTNTITSLSPGTYIVTVTDSHNCTKTSTAQLMDPPLLNLNMTTQNISCFGASNGIATVNVSGGAPGYQYEWSNGGLTNTINNLPAGTYTVTVVDENGCEKMNSVILTEPSAISLSLSAIGVTCFEYSNGSASASVSGGTPGYGYLWSNGANTTTINDLESGIYFITVTDANGCTNPNSVEVGSPPAMLLTFSGQDVSCYGASDGSAFLSVSGGASGYTYLWSNGSNAETINNVIAGNYEVTVTDNNGCTSVGNYLIGSPTALDVVVSTTDVSAPGEADGFASALVNGGTPGYFYLWSTGETSDSINGLEAGNYILTVTDENGCIEEVFFTISSPDCGLSISVAIDPISCYGNQNGAATAGFSGGSGNIEFLWSTGDTSQTISNLGAGTYYVTITDGNCIAISSATLMDPPAIDVQVASEPTACIEATGSATVVANGGTGPSSFLWSNGETAAEIDSLIAGIYSVTVSDTVGCCINMNITVMSVDSVAPVMIQAFDTLYVNSVGAIENFTSLADNFIDDCGAFSYEALNADDLSCGQQQEDTLQIQVTDISGNGQVYDVLITLLDTFPPQFVSCPASIEQGICQGEVLFIEPVASDNCQVAELIQTAGLPSGSEFPVGTTINEWLATDLNGNTQQCSSVVIISAGIVLETAVQPITCHNENDGLITIDTSHLTPPYSIVWSTGDTTAALHDLSGGNYSVIVADDNGCQGMDTFSLTNPEWLFATPQEKQDASSANAHDGYLIINVYGGTMPYTFEWYQGDSLVSNQQNPVNLGPGLYILFLRDAHQCLFIGLGVEIGVTTGSKDITDGQLKIWPNPAKDVLFIESPYIVQSLMLYDMSGQLVETQEEINAPTFHINIKDRHPGLYALVMISGEGAGKIESALIVKAEW